MSNGSSPCKLFRFGRYTLDRGRASLMASGRPVALRPKPFDVLVHLVENPGRVVSKDELGETVWPGVEVTDESIAKSVSEIRLALGADGPRIIKTVPRRGYLFDVAATELDTPELPASKPSAGKLSAMGQLRAAALRLLPSRRAPAVVAAALCLAVLGAGLLTVFAVRAGKPTGDSRPAIAVLPFANEGEAQQEYFSDGIAEDLTTSLGKFSGLYVIGRHSAFTFKQTEVAASEIGAGLGARYLVEGTVRRDGARVRIGATLIEAATGRQIWADRYDRELTGIFAVQDEVVHEIVGRVVGQVTRTELERASSKPPARWAAYDYVLQGKALIDHRRGEDRGSMAASARELFDRAVQLDPGYAPAVEGLASSFAIAWLEPTRYGPFRREFHQTETMIRASELARRATELDPFLARAHATLAWVLHWQYRRDEALSEFERALELNPNLVDGRYGLMLAHDGRATDGIAYLTRIMRQEPMPPAINFSYLGNAYFLAGRYEDARRILKAGIERLPDYRPLYLWLAAAAAQASDEGEARSAAAAALQLDPEFTLDPWLHHIRLARTEDEERLAAGVRKAGLAP